VPVRARVERRYNEPVRPSLAFVIALVACRVPELDFTGKECPCPDGYSCDTGTNTCARGDVVFDASSSADARSDASVLRDAAGSSYRDIVVADAPIAYWRLDDPGPVALDQMGHVNGTYSGNCVYGVAGATDDSDTAALFDGSNCEVSLSDMGNSLEFDGTHAYSVEAWMNDDPVTVGYRVVFSKESRMMSPIDGYALVDSTAGVYFERSVGSSAPTTMKMSHPNNTYVYLVGVYDGSAFTLYIDGSAGTPFADVRSMPAYMATGLIGADLNGDHFAGALDEVAIYGYALTPQQIATHYHAASAH
jgi:hypothetical protein